MQRPGPFPWLVALSLALSFPAPLRAETPPNATEAGNRAIQAGEAGIALYEQGKWNDALERFRTAEALYHSPVFVLYQARSQRNAGHLLEARETFRRLLAEKLEETAPALWKQAQRDGATELAALELNVPSVIVSVEGGSQSTRLGIDDHPAVAGVAFELDPGAHRVEAFDGERHVVRDFTAAVGSRDQRIVVKFGSPAPPAAPPRPAPPAPAEKSGLWVPGLVVAGVGGATLLAGGVVGLLALHEKNETLDGLPPTCVETTCPASRKGEIEPGSDRAKSLGTAADVLFVSGGMISAVGIGLAVLVPNEKAPVAVQASPRSVTVRARF
jgi:hypothetical protein